MTENKSYHVIGLMSGSSLDGLDIAYVRLTQDHELFSYEILHSDCISYEPGFKNRLRNISSGSAYELSELHTGLGKYFGKLAKEFIDKNKIAQLDLVVSHGQTIFHQPQKGFTTQIGCGAQIAAITNCKTVCDLRTTDIAYGGQGAPVVPIAEKYLFPRYKVFLNLGGIANISFHEGNGVLAYDVCACNTLLNTFAQQKGKTHDEGGSLARTGKINPGLLNELNGIDFCKKDPPKSLGTEHIVRDWFPLFDKYEISAEDKLATAVEHIAITIAKEVNSRHSSLATRLLISGGGALNLFLIERIQEHLLIYGEVPDHKTVQFKEALAMAFIGVLRMLEMANVLRSVTGASKDSIGGAVYLP